MINDLINMSGYGLYVWSSFIFTLICFISLYSVTKIQLQKEKNKFKEKYFDLTAREIVNVKKQGTYREILTFTNISKI